MKNCVTARVYADLNYFIDESQRQRDMTVCFYGKRSVKDLVESLGIPHVEVEMILVDGEKAGFDRVIGGGERISVYPKFTAGFCKEFNGTSTEDGPDIGFVLDVHLGKLARYLRMMGFDAYYDNSLDDEELADISSKQGRVLLTRDRGLLKRALVDRGLIIRDSDPVEQARQVLDYFGIWNSIRPFSVCIECGERIKAMNPGSGEWARVESDVPPRVRQWCTEYFICTVCKRIYWKGSHYEDMMKTIDRIRKK